MRNTSEIQVLGVVTTAITFGPHGDKSVEDAMSEEKGEKGEEGEKMWCEERRKKREKQEERCQKRGGSRQERRVGGTDYDDPEQSKDICWVWRDKGHVHTYQQTGVCWKTCALPASLPRLCARPWRRLRSSRSSLPARLITAARHHRPRSTPK